MKRKYKEACEKPFERNSAKITLQLLTTNTTVRKINYEVCAVTFAQVYVVKISGKNCLQFCFGNITRKDWRL